MPSQQTATVAAVSSQTKAAVAVGVTLLAGLGAYGFGFLPFLDQDQANQSQAACFEQCVAQRDLCANQSKDVSQCDQPFQLCNQSCADAAVQQDEPTNDQVNQPPPSCEAVCQDTVQYCFKLGGDPIVCQEENGACLQSCANQAAGGESSPPPATTPPAMMASTTPPVIMATTTLRIESYGHPAPTILVAGTDIWHPIAQYRAVADAADVSIHRLRVQNFSSPEAIRDVAIAQDGTILATGFFPAGSGASYAFDLSARPLAVPRGGSTVFQVWVRLNPVADALVSSSGATTTLMAAQARVGLGYLSEPHGRLPELEASAPGATVEVQPSSPEDTLLGNNFVVRRTKITVRPIPLSSSLRSGSADVDLYRVQFRADELGGSAALKKLTFFISPTLGSGSSLSLSSFGLRRGSTELSPSQFTLLDASGRDVRVLAPTTTIDLSYGPTWVTLTFANEQIINPSGVEFTLHARAMGLVSMGDGLSIAFPRISASPFVNGYLTENEVSATELGQTYLGPHLDLSSPANGSAISPATFLWSDQSAIVHSSRPGTRGGSADWMNDGWLEWLGHNQMIGAATTTH